MRRVSTPLLCLTALSLLSTGCWRPDKPSLAELQRGQVWLFPGVEGGAPTLRSPYHAFRDAGVDQSILIFDWERPIGGLANLVDYDGNRQRARQTARALADYRRKHPAGVIDLVGYSGGGGMALFVAEELPADIRVRNIILCQAAVSPDYDLRPALARVDGCVVNFFSPLDWTVLGAGTTVFGTMDRKHASSAGKVAFDSEEAVPDPALRSRLKQHKWDSRQILGVGHTGGHFDILGYAWNRRYVAPHLLLKPDAGISPVADGLN